MFVGDAFAELGRRSARRKLRRDAAQHELARQQALGALAEHAAHAGVLVPAEQQALGQVAGHAGGLAQHVAALQGEIARLEAQRNAMIQGNAPQPAIADVDKTLYRLRGELTAKASHSSAATTQRAAVLAQIGGAVYARAASLGNMPALQPHFAHVAQIDHALAGTAQQLQGSIATSAAAPKGAIAKLAATTAVAGIGGIVAIAVATSATAPSKQAETKSTDHAATTATGPAASTAGSAAEPPPRPVAAFQPFSADENVTGVGPPHVVKLYAAEFALRSEGEENGRSFIVIVRRDKQVVWELSPESKTYVEHEIRVDPAPWGTTDVYPKGCTPRGQDMIAGYVAIRWECVFHPTKSRTFNETRWVADQLGGLIVKRTDTIATVEMANIHIGPQDAALFEIPTDYQPKP